MALEVDIVVRLQKILEKKGWITRDPAAHDHKNTHERFCLLLDALSPEEARLMLNLTENFEKIDVAYCASLLKSALALVDETLIAGASRIFVLPLLASGDEKRVKSGSIAAYTLLHLGIRPYLEAKALASEAHDCHSLEYLPDRVDKGPALLFVVDDFIGTGQTAIDFIVKYEADYRQENDSLIFISAAAMPSGIKRILDRGYEIKTALIQSRGISDSGILDRVPTAMQIMDGIEARLDVEYGCNRGFGESEALISFTRTPDNTFPVYWAKKKKEGTQWPAPFPR